MVCLSLDKRTGKVAIENNHQPLRGAMHGMADVKSSQMSLPMPSKVQDGWAVH
jgi:hypothetical protein